MQQKSMFCNPRWPKGKKQEKKNSGEVYPTCPTPPPLLGESYYPLPMIKNRYSYRKIRSNVTIGLISNSLFFSLWFIFLPSIQPSRSKGLNATK